MGGLGKTTLAQLAYQDDQVNQHFQLKSWVCVSEDFDVVRLTKAMLQSLNVEASGLSELDPLHRKLLQKLKGQGRLLLVLDDVWEAQNLNIHNWNLLTAPLRNRSAGTKVIITTRSRIVSEMAPRTLTHDLGFLSFLLPGEKFKLSISGHELPSCSYTRMEHLRVLDLRGVRLDRLPESIASLKHLRYLRISSVVDELPESVGSMYHLQTLDSRGVRELPNSMSNLLNLRHLILSSSDTIEYPVGIGKLTELQTVPGFRVSPKHNRAKLGELKDLNNIRGEFAIKGLENLADVNEARKACLDKKRNISSLHLEWDPKADSWHIDEEVLESLKPSVKLATLKILGFNGPSYPSWLGDGSFSRLGTIKLEHCENWTFLPPLGQLPSLRSLNISQARAVEYIGSDFLHSRLFSVSFLQCSTCEILPALSQLPSPVELYVGGASNLENVELDSLSSYDQMSERGRQATYTSIAFPRLQKLEFHDMPIWEEWLGAKEGDFPFLWKLVLKRCPRLRALPHLPPGLKELYVEDCEELQCLSSFSQGLKSLKSLWLLSVTNCPNLDFTATEGPPPKLELMYLTSCPLLLAWCEGHPRMLERIPNIWVDGVRVSPKGRKVSNGKYEDVYASVSHLSKACFRGM
ncbi:hypothetical protein Taro_056216, partial [Colocasia esculenta]|nr:hypothetical protein [Colocasia esculenta]